MQYSLDTSLSVDLVLAIALRHRSLNIATRTISDRLCSSTFNDLLQRFALAAFN
jgi:archaellum biogenesis protein FlaJ (TadC family)